MTDNRALRVVWVALVALICLAGHAAGQSVPERPQPARLVNDLAGILTVADIEFLEDTLVRFDRHTSTQIAIVTMSDLGGETASEMAQQIGQAWGVGQKDKNNGIVILVQPKTAESGGHVFISTGYGAEGALPDITCSRITKTYMVPYFQKGKYSLGVRLGAIAVMQAIESEYSADKSYYDDYGHEDESVEVVLVIVVIIILVVFVLSGGSGRGRGGRRHLTSDSGIGWMLADALLSGLSGSSGWGSFSGGRGGFGGFGGGSFGGGGGGSSW